MIIKYSPFLVSQLKKVDVRIRKSFKEAITKFSKNPQDSQLRNHSLKREYLGYRSINITADWRAIYEQKQEGKKLIAYFVLFGTHKELYG